MMGAASPLPRTAPATLAAPLPATGERDDYLRAFRTEAGIVSVTSQDSAATPALAMADCLILPPAGSAPAAAGTPVPVLTLAYGKAPPRRHPSSSAMMTGGTTRPTR